MSKIAIIGAGAWGSALANLIANNNHQVNIWAHREEKVTEINQSHTNSEALPDIKLSHNIKASSDMSEVMLQSEAIFLVTPSQFIKDIAKQMQENIGENSSPIVICCKGFDPENLKLISQIVTEFLPQNPVSVVSGPNFAHEIASGLPATTTISAQDTDISKFLSEILSNANFSTEISNDIISAQICGTIKNVLAIGCGIIEGLELGANARAAFLTRGFKEIGDLSEKLGGNRKSLELSSGIGDIFLTCSSLKSRNCAFGYKIGSGTKLSRILANSPTIEGYQTARLMPKISQLHQIELPACLAVSQIISHDMQREEIVGIIGDIL